MGPFPLDLKEEAQVALVSNRDRLPSARFTDDQEIRRRMVREQGARPTRIELFSNRADDDDLARPLMAASGDEGGREGTFRIAGPATVQPPVLDLHRQGSVDRVDVVEDKDCWWASDHVLYRVPDGVRLHITAATISRHRLSHVGPRNTTGALARCIRSPPSPRHTRADSRRTWNCGSPGTHAPRPLWRGSLRSGRRPRGTSPA